MAAAPLAQGRPEECHCVGKDCGPVWSVIPRKMLGGQGAGIALLYLTVIYSLVLPAVTQPHIMRSSARIP